MASFASQTGKNLNQFPEILTQRCKNALKQKNYHKVSNVN
jgi:hypothetical protein